MFLVIGYNEWVLEEDEKLSRVSIYTIINNNKLHDRYYKENHGWW